MQKFCTECGTKLNDNARFCTVCGALQNEEPPQTENPIAENTETVPAEINSEQTTAVEEPAVETVIPVLSSEEPYTIPNTAYKQADTNTANSQDNNDFPKVQNFNNYAMPTQSPTTKSAATGIFATLAILIIAAVVIAVIIIRNSDGFSLTISAYKQPVELLCESIEERSADKLLEAYPDDTADMIAALSSFSNIDKQVYAKKYLQNLLDNFYDNACEKYGDDFTLTCDLGSKSKLSQEDLDQNYDYTDATEGYSVDVDYTFSGSKDSQTVVSSIDVLHGENKWYVPMSFKLSTYF